MAAFLLLWSPKGWQWDPSAYTEVVHRTANGEGVGATWSTGQRRDGIGAGDRGYLVRTRDARGIVAAATFDGGILEDTHWDGSGRRWPSAPLTWDTLVDPRQRLRVEDLKLRVPRSRGTTSVAPVSGCRPWPRNGSSSCGGRTPTGSPHAAR